MHMHHVDCLASRALSLTTKCIPIKERAANKWILIELAAKNC